jgi:hypothetical protein
MVVVVVEAVVEAAVAKEVEVEAAAEEATEDEGGRGVVWANILDSDEIRGKVDVVVVVLLRSNRLVVV